MRRENSRAPNSGHSLRYFGQPSGIASGHIHITRFLWNFTIALLIPNSHLLQMSIPFFLATTQKQMLSVSHTCSVPK